MTDHALSWLKIWGTDALYWCPNEVYAELQRLGLVDGERVTIIGRAALNRH